MAIWAIVDNRGELMVGQHEPFVNKPLIAVDEKPLSQYRDGLLYCEAKHMKVVELVQRTGTR